MKKRGWTLQEWTVTEDIAGVEFAGVDNDGGNHRRWAMTERITSS